MTIGKWNSCVNISYTHIAFQLTDKFPKEAPGQFNTEQLPSNLAFNIKKVCLPFFSLSPFLLILYFVV